jgi:hypothetical protein
MGSNFPNNVPDSGTSLVQNQRLSNSELFQKTSFVLDIPNAETKSKSNIPYFQENVISNPAFSIVSCSCSCDIIAESYSNEACFSA